MKNMTPIPTNTKDCNTHLFLIQIYYIFLFLILTESDAYDKTLEEYCKKMFKIEIF